MHINVLLLCLLTLSVILMTTPLMMSERTTSMRPLAEAQTNGVRPYYKCKSQLLVWIISITVFKCEQLTVSFKSRVAFLLISS